MKFSHSKTEYMNERDPGGTGRLQGAEVKKVQELKYLGSTVQSNGECGKEAYHGNGNEDAVVLTRPGGPAVSPCSPVSQSLSPHRLMTYLPFIQEFHPKEDMPIRLECDGKLVENMTSYQPYNHIKMQPPGVPNVSRTANETWITWSLVSPLSIFLDSFEFQVQIKQKTQTWKEAKTLSTQGHELRIPSQQLKGFCKVRVRVKPFVPSNSHWSNWSPTASWAGATDEDTSQDQDWFWIVRAVLLSTFLLILMLILFKTWVNKGRIKGKPVPNPSKYFHTLHSVHEGNLKKWLNPLPVTESFFTAQPCDLISPVEVCESWTLVPSTSPSSSSSSFKSPASAGSDTSGMIDNSSSSSCFSNMGYFMSSSSGSSARTEPNPAYFSYQEDFHIINKGHNLQLSFCSSLGTSKAYETLKREPQSPDSGFATGREDEEDQQDERDLDAEMKEVSDDLFLLPLHLPFQMCPPSSAPPPPHPASPTQKSSDTEQMDVRLADASGSYAAWPNAGAMCRSSSMPVEPSHTGYLTLKELQTTFSNKSI
ncbi:Interleukin-2 receptor subunit beta [Channa argus]|uniref:Interleukin-2 receptor subunit beta n=1 Tax=Channa argus TaxID=215402 RepID=A0A6G1QDG5_CHAAH|nr:Interleukin-2 receptor subunit beta [Channa argus]